MKAVDAINEFVKLTANRLPTLAEVFELCDSCRIRLKVRDGEPIMALPGACLKKCGSCDFCRENASARQVSEIVTELISREPWRSQIISNSLLQEQA